MPIIINISLFKSNTECVQIRDRAPLRFTHEWIYSCYMQTLARSLKQGGEQARTALWVLETQTYSCVNLDDLHGLTSKVEELTVTLKETCRSQRDSYCNQNLENKARERAQKVCRKYRPILHRDDTKTIGGYQNHVGKRATELQKVSKEVGYLAETSYNLQVNIRLNVLYRGCRQVQKCQLHWNRWACALYLSLVMSLVGEKPIV